MPTATADFLRDADANKELLGRSHEPDSTKSIVFAMNLLGGGGSVAGHVRRSSDLRRGRPPWPRIAAWMRCSARALPCRVHGKMASCGTDGCGRCGPGEARSSSKHGPQTTRDDGVLIMRKLIATVFNYSLDGLLADEGTEFWKFCFSLPENREPDDAAQLDFLRSAYAHIMGRTAYEAISRSMTTTSTDHPFADILNAARKVVFSRTLKTADWANTTIAAGDTAEEIDKLRRGGDDHIVVWGGVSLVRSLMRLDRMDELHASVLPYV